MVDRILDLRNILTDLHKDNRIDSEMMNQMLGTSRTPEQTTMHPVSYVASQMLDDLTRPGKKLDEMAITAWLADKSNLQVFHIDPMKLQVADLAGVMSYQFAKRHDLLCVNINTDELTVAVGQPFVESWIEQLMQTSHP